MSENISTVTPLDPPFDSDGNPIHCVRIFTRGPNSDSGLVRVVFPDKETKKKYIKQEYSFCKDAETAYLAARFINHRERTRAELYAKRVAFAKQQDYIPKPGNPGLWFKAPKLNTDGSGLVA